MRSWRIRQTGVRRPPPSPRVAWAVAILGTWIAFGIWITFAFDRQITNLWAGLGLYGDPDPDKPFGDYHAFSYDRATVLHVNDQIDRYGNVVLFAPLVLVALLLRPRTRWFQVAGAVAILASAVELGQYRLGGRVAQASDVAWNTIGAVAVFAALCCVRSAWRGVRERLARRLPQRTSNADQVASTGVTGSVPASAVPGPPMPPPRRPAPCGRP